MIPDDSARCRATVQYDGSAFSGWQIQPDRRTVQGELEATLSRIFDRETRVDAAGRTDAGVHAAGQEIAFPLPLRWDASEVLRAVNAVLSDEIRLSSASATRPDFHPRFDATARRYEYYITRGTEAESPLRSGRAWRLADALDDARLRGAASLILGPHMFGRFAKSGQPDVSPHCSIERAIWTYTPLGDLRFTVVADRFLHRMVRYLVGVMVDVARGRRDIDDVRRLLAAATDVRAPQPAPAEALYLTGVRYTDGWNREAGVPGLS